MAKSMPRQSSRQGDHGDPLPRRAAIASAHVRNAAVRGSFTRSTRPRRLAPATLVHTDARCAALAPAAAVRPSCTRAAPVPIARDLRRPHRIARASSSAATNALAVIGPMLGSVVRRCDDRILRTRVANVYPPRRVPRQGPRSGCRSGQRVVVHAGREIHDCQARSKSLPVLPLRNRNPAPRTMARTMEIARGRASGARDE